MTKLNFELKPNIGIDNIKFGMTREEVREILKGYEYQEYKETDSYDDIELSFAYNEVNKLYQLGSSNLETFLKEGEDSYFILKKDLEELTEKFNLQKDELMGVWFSSKLGLIIVIYNNKIDSLILCTEEFLKNEDYIE